MIGYIQIDTDRHIQTDTDPKRQRHIDSKLIAFIRHTLSSIDRTLCMCSFWRHTQRTHSRNHWRMIRSIHLVPRQLTGPRPDSRSKTGILRWCIALLHLIAIPVCQILTAGRPIAVAIVQLSPVGVVAVRGGRRRVDRRTGIAIDGIGVVGRGDGADVG